MTNLKHIAATLAILGSGAFTVSGCHHKKDTEVPGAADASGGDAAGEAKCGGDAHTGEGHCGAEGEEAAPAAPAEGG